MKMDVCVVNLLEDMKYEIHNKLLNSSFNLTKNDALI